MKGEEILLGLKYVGMKMRFKRSDLPLEEEEFQSLLSSGLIKQRGSVKEELCQTLGIPYKPDPNEIPDFDIDKSIIIKLLNKGALDPQFAETRVINTDVFFGNRFSQEINAHNTSIYSKFLYNDLITEIGFSFNTDSLIQLQNSLNNSDIKNYANQEKNFVCVPFFITTWDEKKDAYHYTTIDMTNFESWLQVHFSHNDTHYTIDGLLSEFQQKMHLDNSQIINSPVIKAAIIEIKSQLGRVQSDNSEQNNENLQKRDSHKFN